MQHSKGRLFTLLVFAILFLALLAGLLLSARRLSTNTVPELRLEALSSAEEKVLRCPSRWRGYLTIRDHRGEGILSDGTRAVTGVFDRADEGSYFELYDASEGADETPILSLWVRLENDTLIPLIGVHDAWFFDIWLDERDAEPFTLRLEDGGLSLDYFYDDGLENCRIEFRIIPEKNT